jgi:hypothetical protein
MLYIYTVYENWTFGTGLVYILYIKYLHLSYT